MAELYGRRISTVLATDTYMKVRVNRFSKFNGHFHKLANANLVEFCEWIVLKDLSVIVCIQELTSVITGESV